MKQRDIRKTKAYKRLSPFEAVAVIEGFSDKKKITTEDLHASWQYIYDKGIHNKLQGYYGRNVDRLLKSGMIRGLEY